MNFFLNVSSKNWEYDTRKYHGAGRELRSEKTINNIFHHYVRLEDTTKIKIYLHTISIEILFFKLYKMYLDPVTVYGEGNYGLSVIKEVKVTEDFLTLDKTVTDCQMESSVADCTSKLYLTALLSSCGCVPLSLSSVYRSHPVSISRVRPVGGDDSVSRCVRPPPWPAWPP